MANLVNIVRSSKNLMALPLVSSMVISISYIMVTVLG